MTAEEDRQNRRAIASLVRRLRERDEAARNGADVPDWEPFAAEYIAAIRGQGWRWIKNLAPAVIHAGDAAPPKGFLAAKAAIEANAERAAIERARAEGRLSLATEVPRQDAGTGNQEGTTP